MIGPRIAAVPIGNGVAQSAAITARTSDGVVVGRLHPGYSEVEHIVSGVAGAYSGPASRPATSTAGAFPFATRVLARFPSDPSRFSGRVILEPFNSSNGPDVDALWARVAPLLESYGDAWVGVTVRASSARHLRAFDPVRYAGLDLAVNDLAWDILSQVAKLIKNPDDSGRLLAMPVEHLYLAGYSQSAADTATFAMTRHNGTRLADGRRVIDGYFPAAHSASLTPLQSGERTLPVFEYAPIGSVDVPVIDVETQTDVEGFISKQRSGREYTSRGGASVRRPDSDEPRDRYRLYEIAGAAHVARTKGCDGDGSTFPTEAFMRAGLARLYRWAERDITPPTAPRIALIVQDLVAVAAVDVHGNALGGVRSPHLDVPLARYEAHTMPGARCALTGRETPLPAGELKARYLDAATYLRIFTERLDASVRDGCLLEIDKPAIIATQTLKANLAFAQG